MDNLKFGILYTDIIRVACCHDCYTFAGADIPINIKNIAMTNCHNG